MIYLISPTRGFEVGGPIVTDQVEWE